MPVYYGGDLNDSDCENPGDIDYETWVDWCDSDTPDRYCGFSPDDEETQLPVIICATVLRGRDMDEPLRLRLDSWDASVSVTDINSDPVVDLWTPDTVRWDGIALTPDTVRWDGIALHKVGDSD